MIIDNKFNFGQMVYLVTDTEQLKRIVIGIWVKPNEILYQLQTGTSYSWHYDIEISPEKDIVTTITS